MKVIKRILYLIMLWEVTYILISTQQTNADSRFFLNVGSIYQNTRHHIAEESNLHFPAVKKSRLKRI